MLPWSELIEGHGGAPGGLREMGPQASPDPSQSWVLF